MTPFLYQNTTEIPVIVGDIISNIIRDINIFKIYRNDILSYNISDIVSKNTSEDLNSNYIISPNNNNLIFSFIKRLGPQGKIGTPYVFKCIENDVIFKKSNNISLICELFDNTTDDFKCLSNQITVSNSCININYPKKFVGSSEYINEIIIGYFFDDIFFPSLLDRNNLNEDQLNNLCSGKLLSPYDLGYSVFQLGYFQAKELDTKSYFQSVETNVKKLSGFNVMEKAEGTIEKIFNNIDDEDSIYKKIKVYNKDKQS